jgi:hypothetical protein
MKEQEPNLNKPSNKSAHQSSFVNAISGLFGGIVGKTLLHPVDTVKAKIQV